MRTVDSASLGLGIAMMLLGLILLLVVEHPLVRLIGGLSALAIGLGALRRGFRID